MTVVYAFYAKNNMKSNKCENSEWKCISRVYIKMILLVRRNQEINKLKILMIDR